MKTLNRTQENTISIFILSSVSIALLFSSTLVLSDGSPKPVYEGIAIQGALTSQQLVQLTNQEDEEEDLEFKGQIPVAWYQDMDDVVKLAQISQAKAIALGNALDLGKVFKAKLDEDENYLVWELAILGRQGQTFDLTLDAGNGKVIKLKLEESDED